MANFGREEINRGSITLRPAHPGLTTVFFEPTAETLRYLRRFQRRTIGPVKLLEFDSRESRASIYPINTHLAESKFALPKYDQVRVISLPLDSIESPVSTEQVDFSSKGYHVDLLKAISTASVFHVSTRSLWKRWSR